MHVILGSVGYLHIPLRDQLLVLQHLAEVLGEDNLEVGTLVGSKEIVLNKNNDINAMDEEGAKLLTINSRIGVQRVFPWRLRF